MILNIAFTHPEKIYKGNKTVTNSEGNVARLSRQKWRSMCSWRNALWGCAGRAWLGPAWPGAAILHHGSLSPSFWPDWVSLCSLHGTGWQPKAAILCMQAYFSLSLVSGARWVNHLQHWELDQLLEALRRGWWKDLKFSYHIYQVLSVFL